MSDLKEVFTVDKNTNGVVSHMVCIVSTKEEAQRRVRMLNEKYSYGVELDKDMCNIIENDENIEIIRYTHSYLYYNVGAYYIDDEFCLDKDSF